MSLVTVAATSIAVTHICVGRRASVGRSYQSLSNTRGILLSTGLLLYVLPIALSFVAVLLSDFYPGGRWNVALVFAGVFVTVPLVTVLALTVVVVGLERRGGFGAIKRSYGLARGHLWRNVGVLTIVFTAMTGCEGMAIAGLLAVELVLGTDQWTMLDEILPAALGLNLVTVIVTPLMNVALVVLYYDCRVRKEGRDVCGLALAQV